jgi:hypothetical protein
LIAPLPKKQATIASMPGSRSPCAAPTAIGMPPPPAMTEAHRRIAEASSDAVAVLALDSVSLVAAEDAGHIAVTGPHGGLLGRRAATAAKVPVFAALFNDAGIGIDGAGTARSPRC